MGLIYKDGIPYGGGGHNIVNSENEILPQRNRVQINGANIVDDPQHDKTILNIESVDISGKADKVTSATNGNLASLDANGNLTDSGIPSVTTITSTDPYTYRQGKGNLADMEIEGASVAWNQLVQNGNFASTSNWQSTSASLTVANNEATITLTGNEWNNDLRQSSSIVANHVYMMIAKVKASSGVTRLGFYLDVNRMGEYINVSQSYQTFIRLRKSDASGSYFRIELAENGSSLSGRTYNVKEYNLFDLTLLFGSTIADAIYAMEQATAGAGVAFFRKYFPKDYYAYDPGSIQSVCVGSRKVVGKNLCKNTGYSQTVNGVTFTVNPDGSVSANGTASEDAEFTVMRLTDPVPISRIGKYIISFSDTNGSPSTYQMVTYARRPTSGYVFDIVTGNKEYIVSCDVIPIQWRFAIRIKKNYNPNGKTFYPMIRSAVVENGTWEPYNPNQYEYPFDSTKQLRGMFSLVGGELKANGDKWRGDKIQRNWAILSNQTGAIGDTITLTGLKTNGNIICSVGLISEVGTISGTTLTLTKAISGADFVYELATPTTESAQPYQNPQRAYIDGTEEFIDGLTRDVMISVGNNTTYQQDKILPSVGDYVDAVADNIDLSGKADKVSNATNGHLAGLDSSGNLTDSGIPSVTTLLSTDPYTYRQGKGNLTDMEIVGASVGWNQLVANSGTVSVTVPSGHKYLSKISGSWSISQSSGTAISSLVGGTDMIIDLTQDFNPTIADAIYAMETATAGAGVAFFRKYFSKDYYAYDAGSIQSVCVGSRKVVGFNQWDEEWEVGGLSTNGNTNSDSDHIRGKNYYKCLPNTSYFFYYGVSGKYLRVCWYDENKTFISYQEPRNNQKLSPSNAAYFRIATATGSSTDNVPYKNNICINISDPDRNGTYEPYTETAYPFDSTKQLRGMFSLKGGELKANGDVWRGDKIQRNWLEPVNLGTLDWMYQDELFYFIGTSIGAKSKGLGICTKYTYKGTNSALLTGDKQFIIGTNNIVFRDYSYTDAATFKAAMSGVYLIAEAATPTTESAQPYQNPQRAYIDGTEEFTDGLTRDVMIPVGNNTTYQQDKILPSVEDYVDAVADNIDLSGKADKVSNATNGHLAGLDANGNIKDSGIDPTSLGGAPKLDINPSSATISNYPNGALWLTSSNNEVNLFTKINGIYTLKLEDALSKTALKFSSDDDFYLQPNGLSWDGTMEYSLNGITWNTWDGVRLHGTATQPIYLRGTGNTTMQKGLHLMPWSFAGKYCTGNIENLLDYQTVASGGHPVMAEGCYKAMFVSSSLIQAPELPATTLTADCYTNMFANCRRLTKIPKLPATTLTSNCYAGMFQGCTSLKFSTTQTGEYQYAYRIPTTGTGTTATDALTDMFKSTGGTFTGTPTINTTYYTTNQPV